MKHRKIQKNELDLIFDLIKKHKWLLERDDELKELLCECEDTETQMLVCKLLHEFKYLYNDNYYDAISQIANKITTKWGLKEKTTQIVAFTENAYEADSALKIIYDLKIKIGEQGWKDVSYVNRYGACSKKIETSPDIVLVDEFIGSGKTVINRITNIKNNLKGHRFTIRVAVVSAMQNAILRFMDNVNDIFVVHELKKGISDNYTGVDFIRRCRQMIKLENNLKQQIKDTFYPRFGYGKAQALYARENGNAPNSVFPVFWWQEDKNGTTRNTILKRVEQ